MGNSSFYFLGFLYYLLFNFYVEKMVSILRSDRYLLTRSFFLYILSVGTRPIKQLTEMKIKMASLMLKTLFMFLIKISYFNRFLK